jgi:protein TonB
MIARVFISIFLAIVVTFSLFWGMQALIFMDKMEKPTKEKRARINLGEVRDATEMEQKVRKPDKPDEQEAPPEAAPPEMDNSADTNAISLAAPTAQANTGIEMGGGGGFAMSDGDMLPIVRVQAQYPRRASERGLEGYVVLTFTVNKLGRTENVTVLESTSRVFEKSAIKAVLKYRYKPKVVDGDPVATPGVTYKLTFTLETR